MRFLFGFGRKHVSGDVLLDAARLTRRFLATPGHQVDVVQWGDEPILLRLLPRIWGPVMSFPAETIGTVTRSRFPEVLGVVRHPFSHHKAREEIAMEGMVRFAEPGVKHCYVSPKLFHSAGDRCLVDEYRLKAQATYHLTRSSVDLVGYLQQHGFTLTLLPGNSIFGFCS